MFPTLRSQAYDTLVKTPQYTTVDGLHKENKAKLAMHIMTERQDLVDKSDVLILTLLLGIVHKCG